MNWLGKIIQTYIDKNDTVLDIGCGIMQATTDVFHASGNDGDLRCKTIIGVDVYTKYLDKIKNRYPTIRSEAQQTNLFIDKSYDVVLCLDVLEHLPNKKMAITLLEEMKRIARKHVIAYTPKEFHSNEEHAHESWGMGENIYQTHHILITQDEFRQHGYKVSTTEIDHNTFAVYSFQIENTSLITRERSKKKWWSHGYIREELYYLLPSVVFNVIFGVWRFLMKLLRSIRSGN